MCHFVGVGIFWIDPNRTDLGCWRLTERLLTHVGFFRKHGLILSDHVYGKEQVSRQKKFHNRAKNSSSWESLTIETSFLDIKKSNSKRLSLNDSKCSQSPKDSL